ncbi:WD40 repeat domain-containing protein [Ancylobacter amanitiformis]|uniref:Dipeptidyl aminopeptidase/acylaminoacyl peptidase n=1 Tax=Ancylobacter amanitiformis TaxID=217069 RepID=A0ABU0LMH3_9HYPH|nr:WD40 repeat domain-containing protein [Ancylobacter amanitiformis]MDQ0509904.1 dipeptidyl aminopeptidase/acylaminoacyl peptidase [Ancylobacter amanitiformis]
MNIAEAETTPLVKLLARRWRLGEEVGDCRFDRAGGRLAFVLGDGTLALASMDDPESAQARWRVALDTGRASIAPRRRPVPPLMRLLADVAPLRVAPFGAEGFIVGGASGRLVRVAPDGTTAVLVEIDTGAVDAIEPLPDHSALVAAGGVVVRYDAGGGTARALAHMEGPLRALAAAPDGDHVALATPDAVAVIGLRDAGRTDLALARAQVLAWSPDGQRLAIGLTEGGLALLDMEDGRVLRLPDYPAPIRSLDWSADGSQLVTGGAFRTIVWDMAEPGDRPRTIETGRAGMVTVEVVRRHPRRPLVAVGYEDGSIVIARIGHRDELLLREPSAGQVEDLRWSGDGEHLAFTTAQGELGVIDLPPHMFK